MSADAGALTEDLQFDDDKAERLQPRPYRRIPRPPARCV
jgi:hypothetical protein